MSTQGNAVKRTSAAAQNKARKRPKKVHVPNPLDREDFQRACMGFVHATLRYKRIAEDTKEEKKQVANARTRIDDTMRQYGKDVLTKIPLIDPATRQPLIDPDTSKPMLCNIRRVQTNAKFSWDKEDLVKHWVTTCGMKFEQAMQAYAEEHELLKEAKHKLQVDCDSCEVMDFSQQ